MSERFAAPAIQRLVANASLLNGRAGNHAYAFRVPPDVADAARLERVYRSFGRMFEIIRTRICQDTADGWVCELAGEDILAPVEVRQLGRLDDPRTVAEIGAAARRPMHPGGPPHFDLLLFDCAGEHILVTRGHHIVLDGASRLLMMTRLLEGNPLPANLAPEAASESFGRASAFERATLGSRVAHRTLVRAEALLANHAGRQVVPYPQGAPYPSSRLGVVRALGRADSERLLASCEAEGMSLFGLGLSCFSVALGAISGQSAHVISVPHSVRYRLKLPTRVGNFMDYLFVEVSADPDQRRRGLEAGAAVLSAAREFLPLQCVIEAVTASAAPALNPFLRITAADLTGGDGMPSALLAMPGDAEPTDPQRCETVPIPSETVPLEMPDVGFLICRRNGQVRWRLGGRSDVYSPEVLDALSERVGSQFHRHLMLQPAS